MRPRHYTAENSVREYCYGTGIDASMRPRHYTAENHLPDWQRSASMRPRHYTAENQVVLIAGATPSGLLQ